MEEYHDTIVCPQCGAVLIPEQCTKKTYRNFGYTSVFSTIGDWQVVRYYCTKADTRQGDYDIANSCWKDGKASYYHFEFLRKWYNTKTGFVVTERTATSMMANYLNQPYSMWSDLWIAKSETYWTSEWFRHYTCPYGSLHEQLRKRGFSINALKKVGSVMEVIVSVFSCPYAETLLKQGIITALNYFSSSDKIARLQEFREQLRIACKHGLDLSKLNMADYIDYIEQLKRLGYDIHSPKWLCPADLDAEHSRLNRLIERKEIELKREKYLADYKKNERTLESNYAKRIERFRNLLITDGLIEIRPLQSVREFVDEGAEMKHCVFWNGYYDTKKHPHSLILSAKIHGERIETIEVSTDLFRIEQSRGFQNKPTGRHGEIIALVEKHMPAIRRMAQRAS
jgi:hypothetical protein